METAASLSVQDGVGDLVESWTANRPAQLAGNN